jgi:hypothetical protein
MIFNAAGHERQTRLSFHGKGTGKSRAVLVFLSSGFSAKNLLINHCYYCTIFSVPPIHSACGMFVDISVEKAHKCCSEKAFHQFAYEGGKLGS